MSATRAMLTRAACTILAAVALTGVAACDPPFGGGGGGQPTPTGPPPAGQATPGAATGAPASPAPAAQPGGVLASREVQDGGAQLRVDITGLRRQDQTVTLSWRITVLGGEDASDWYPADTMGAKNLDFTVSGVVLVDPVNAQRYLVARSGGEDGPCACSNNTNFTMDPGDTAEFYATYAAPPADVTAINAEFPRFGAFTDVPLS